MNSHSRKLYIWVRLWYIVGSRQSSIVTQKPLKHLWVLHIDRIKLLNTFAQRVVLHVPVQCAFLRTHAHSLCCYTLTLSLSLCIASALCLFLLQTPRHSHSSLRNSRQFRLTSNISTIFPNAKWVCVCVCASDLIGRVDWIYAYNTRQREQIELIFHL